MTQVGGCGDAFFLARECHGNRRGHHQRRARERSATGPTVLDFTVPDPKVKVEIQRGRGWFSHSATTSSTQTLARRLANRGGRGAAG
jgi:hypothetical protein